jgi:CRISPR/Cas system CSM-associated protein Csm3 (group 7 of RAMP superfamily)
MTTRLTLFKATLVQDSAMSISGLDRDSTSDRPFTIIDGTPVLSGRGLKGAAVAMAWRFFQPLPRSISDEASRGKALRRSAWEFSNAVPLGGDRVCGELRAGVGIRQKTGARASGVLYDLEAVPAGTEWPLSLRVDWSWAEGEAEEAEGILGYVLAHHWAEKRCWLGGDVARGLGWCHIKDLTAWRLGGDDYESWIHSGRTKLPSPLPSVPCVEPTRSWSFRSLNLRVSFGEYRPNGDDEPPWGLDMLAIGPHSAENGVQTVGSGQWARPSWMEGAPRETEIATDRSVAMEGDRPLLPGASLRGPLRHAFSRMARSNGELVQDPHAVQGNVGAEDPAGKIFGSVAQSSRVLICDARAEGGWAAARLHMHAEDEFSAGSYLSAKRDAVRLLRGIFPVRIVVEAAEAKKVDALTAEIDKLVALGACGHLPLGGHKTRGAGWGCWRAEPWQKCDVVKARDRMQPTEVQPARDAKQSTVGDAFKDEPHETQSEPQAVRAIAKHGSIETGELTLGHSLSEAIRMVGDRAGRFVAWWCEPTIDLTVTEPPEVFGWAPPGNSTLRVDEVMVFLERGSWRAARTAKGVRWVLIHETTDDAEAENVEVHIIPARLHGDTTRFAARTAGKDHLLVREWRSGVTPLGFTLNRGGER